MRLPVVLLIVAAAAFLAGGAIIGLPALGACLIVEAICTAAWALLHDDGTAPQILEVPTLRQVLEKAARAS